MRIIDKHDLGCERNYGKQTPLVVEYFPHLDSVLV